MKGKYCEQQRRCRPRWDSEIYSLHKDLNIVDDMEIRILRWVVTSQKWKMKSQKEILKSEIPQHKISSKTKNKMGGRRPDGCITESRNMRMKESRSGVEKNGGCLLKEVRV